MPVKVDLALVFLSIICIAFPIVDIMFAFPNICDSVWTARMNCFRDRADCLGN